METNLSTPNEPINLKVLSNTSNSIEISWNQNQEPMALTFDVQYRIQVLDEGSNNDDFSTSLNKLSWIDHPEPVSAISAPVMPEVQEITTLVDDDSTISAGFFWLKLKAIYSDPTLQSNVLESSTISKPIAFNASAENFEDAVKGIRGVQNVRVFRYEPGLWGTSDLASHGAYSWRVEFQVMGESTPLFQVHKDNLDGKYKGGYLRCRIRRLLKGQPLVYKDNVVTTISDLKSEKYYEFRVRGVNAHGSGPWSALLSDVKTGPFEPYTPPRKPSVDQLNSRHVKLFSGNGQRAGNDIDPDYITPSGRGGFDGEDGANGVVVIIEYGKEKLRIPSRLYYYFSGQSENYVVPGNKFGGKDDSKGVEFIDVKLWGGGGAGGGTTNDFEGKKNLFTVTQIMLVISFDLSLSLKVH